jgi:hypothetical protein
MTEAEWMACADLHEMVYFLFDPVDKPSDRKLRLFGCACARRIWRSLPGDCLRQAVETCERFADGLATREELETAREIAYRLYRGSGDIIEDHGPILINRLCASQNGSFTLFPVDGAASIAAEACDSQGIEWHVAYSREGIAQCALIRDIFGNPFRPALLDPTWLTWNNGAVRKMAQAIYDERRFADLPILADALEDAGCADAAILEHCRQPGEHVRGCWVVDLLLGKS